VVAVQLAELSEFSRGVFSEPLFALPGTPVLFNREGIGMARI